MTMTKRLYTFILAHYEQFRYIFTAIDSILDQDYPAIEIIVIDDGSTDFDKEKALDYIDKNKRENIKSVQVLVNDENIGTVRSLNRALKAAQGEYIQIFAADDRLRAGDIASGFVTEFERLGDEAEIISAQAMYMDEEMNPTGSFFCDLQLHEKFNDMDAGEQFEKVSVKCRWAMGAICARTELYKRIGYFSENCKYVEDWPFFLRATRSGVKVHTIGLTALEHRAGGISTTVLDPGAPLAIECMTDVLNALETEVIPYMSAFPVRHQNEVYEKYYREYAVLTQIGGQRKKLRWSDFCKYSKKIVLWRILTGRWRK